MTLAALNSCSRRIPGCLLPLTCVSCMSQAWQAVRQEKIVQRCLYLPSSACSDSVAKQPRLLKRASLLRCFCARPVLQSAACLAGLKASTALTDVYSTDKSRFSSSYSVTDHAKYVIVQHLMPCLLAQMQGLVSSWGCCASQLECSRPRQLCGISGFGARQRSVRRAGRAKSAGLRSDLSLGLSGLICCQTNSLSLCVLFCSVQLLAL